MPIRQKHDMKSKTLNIEAAFDIDSEESEAHSVPTPTEKPLAEAERKSAIIQIATYPSLRKHFHIEAAKRGEKLAPIALNALIERYGLPED